MSGAQHRSPDICMFGVVAESGESMDRSIEMPHIIALGFTDFESGDREQWLAHAPKLAQETVKEPGCRFYSIVADPMSASRLLVSEMWEDREAFEQHKATIHVSEFLKATAGCRVVHRSVGFYEATETEPGALPSDFTADLS
jgi:quinol monooxygenase YgiN